jgi:hypothetical protein
MTTHPLRPLILIYGNSPQLIWAERALRAVPDLRVIQIDPDAPNAMDQLRVMRQGVLLYDADMVNPAVIQALHTLHPSVATLGLGGDERRTTLMGQSFPVAVAVGLGEALRVLPA